MDQLTRHDLQLTGSFYLAPYVWQAAADGVVKAEDAGLMVWLLSQVPHASLQKGSETPAAWVGTARQIASVMSKSPTSRILRSLKRLIEAGWVEPCTVGRYGPGFYIPDVQRFATAPGKPKQSDPTYHIIKEVA
jgi:hypothetical protein